MANERDLGTIVVGGRKYGFFIFIFYARGRTNSDETDFSTGPKINIFIWHIGFERTI